MSASSVLDVLQRVQTSSQHIVGNAAETRPMVLQSAYKTAVEWSPFDVEASLGLKLPDEIHTLWSRASEIRLLCDVNYGQWGCILWSPAELVARHSEAQGWRGMDDFRPGDLIIGEFLGDTDLVVLRCDPSQQDFGGIVIALGMDPRNDWPRVASSISEFMAAFLACPETKFWDL